MPSSSAPGTRSRRTLAPVASSAWPNATSSRLESLTVRAAASSFITLVRVSSSTSCSAHQPAGRSSVADRATSPRR